MAYACPVCEEPQVDAAHLANHVAFTAITGDADHEAWLDATVPEWGQLGQAELAEIVVDHAEETDYPLDVAAGDAGAGGTQGRDHAHGHAHGDEGNGVPATDVPTADLDADAQDVLAEARKLTEQMAESEGASGDASEDEGDAADESDSETQ